MKIMDKLGKSLLFFDGAMGTMLQESGLSGGELPETWNVAHPDRIRDIHCKYLHAGCDVVTTNTFGCNRLKLHHEDYTAAQLATRAVTIAKEAVQACGRGYVAMGIGPSGKLLKPLGDTTFDEAYAAFAEIAEAGAEAGADLILIETMSDTYELKAAVLAAKEHTNLPVFATVVFDEKGQLLTGADVDATVALLEGLRVDALGINCGMGPKQMLPLLERFLQVSSLPIILNPNAGLPGYENGKAVFDVLPEKFARDMELAAHLGAWVLGGCCGTTPAHIEQLVARCKDIAPVPITQKQYTVVSSYARAVTIGDDPVLIGERINPTGKSRFKQALREGDINYILREGLAQQEKGVHILDVNVGLPEIDEPAMMQSVIEQLQSVTDLPLQIDTSNMQAMERALRLYNGKAMVNSVNGKRESMEQVFPLIKKYGGVVVALTLDEHGIAQTAEERFQVAKKIVDTAAQYGIDRKDIVVDPLTLTISAEQSSALVAIEALHMIRDRLGVKTSLGVSNISFGLPRRELINASFFSLALGAGLNAAIINPYAQSMMDAYYTCRALLCNDPQCMDYIGHYSDQKTTTEPVKKESSALTLFDAVCKGLKEEAQSLAKELLNTTLPLTIIDEQLIPALNRVGDEFEKGKLYLPQLLMSAEAAKAAFAHISTGMQSDDQSRKKDTIIIATVKGDIHDIGKNIVRVLLENYQYHVIDLGRDVPPETIVASVVEHGAKLVGLSALMTTTVGSMEETIRLLRVQAPECKVMVGGAVLTHTYAEKIGADRYVRDAMASVHYAQEIFEPSVGSAQ